ncbi:MAG: DUF374 domain-containing protein [Candidatus Margulisiibacteriota bacterium]
MIKPISSAVKFCAAMLLRLLMTGISRTLDIRISGYSGLNDNSIFAFWHRASFCLFEANPIKKTAVLTAKGGPGDIFTKAVEVYDIRIVQVPFTENPSQASLTAIKLLGILKEGYSLMLAVDGPKGPAYKIKPGVFFLSKRSGKKIVPVGVAAKRRLVIPFRWDEYFIPLPFSRVAVHVDMDYKDDGTAMSLEKAIFLAEEKAAAFLKS